MHKTLNDAQRKITLSILILVFVLQFLPHKTFSAPPAQFTIGLTTRQFDAKNVPAGSIILIAGGTRDFLGISNMNGTVSQPIIIKSSGSRVIINTAYGYGMRVQNSKHFIIDGKQGPLEYNIYINKLNKGQGISLEARSSDFIVRGLEIASAGFAGIMAKSDPYCSTSTRQTVTAENFIMENCVFEYNYIHDTGDGEGMYIGYTFPIKTLSPCGTVVNSHRCRNITVQYNLVERTGADALQVSQCTSGLLIQNNRVLNYGISPFGNFQNSGLSIGAGNYGIIRNNFILTSSIGGNGISIIGSDDLDILNNCIIHKAGMGIYADEQSGRYPATPNGKGMFIDNNTIIGLTGCITDGIHLRTQLVNNTLRNNVIVNPASKYILKYTPDVVIIENTNKKTLNTSTLGFNNVETYDYTLTPNSILINTGSIINTTNVDFKGLPRPSGSTYDIGAYEFQLNTGNANPITTAGLDQIITFPQITSLQLSGNATDIDGTIVNWNWTNESSLSATIAGASTKNLILTNLQIGVYTFRLTCTDNLGASSFDEVNVTVNGANILPNVSMITSASTGSLLINSILTLTAEATDADGTISKVTFMNGATKLGDDFTSPYSISVNNLASGVHQLVAIATDNKGGERISSSRQIIILSGSSCIGSGTILREQWNNLSGTTLVGLNLNNMIPSSTNALNELGITTNVGDNYASRLRGYICPPLSGNYTFWIAGDDYCELWLSTDISSGNKVKIAHIDGFTNVGEYNKYASQQSINISLVAGQSYYIEILQKEAFGEDHVSIGWRLPEGTLERPISSNRISAYVNQLPTASAGSNITLTLPENTATLLSSSYDVDGSILNFTWSSISGGGTIIGGTSSNSLQLTNLPVGVHTYRLQVQDNSGAYSFANKTITVLPANMIPQSYAGIDQTLTLPLNTIILNGAGTDQDGTIVDYLWTQVSGTTATMQNVYTPNLLLTNLVVGSHIFRLMAMDNTGAVNFDEAVVTVLPGIKTVIYRVNCGGPQLSDLPISWSADNNSNSSVNLDPQVSSNVSISKDFSGLNSTGAINDIFTDFRYEDFGKNLKYNFPVNNGDFEIRLFFAENIGSITSRSRARLFDVQLEEQLMIENLDIYDEAGNDALEKSFTLTITDGVINLELITKKNFPSISGIEISSISGIIGNKIIHNNITNTSTLLKIDGSTNTINVYPNPFNNKLNIEFEDAGTENIVFQLFDLSGRKLIENTVNFQGQNNTELDFSDKNLTAGVYFIKAIQGDKVFTQKVIKN